jgi:DNA-binding CsgD family transcriptional regulator
VTSRTVDNHLARIYSKLGVGSRAELADALSGNE